MSVTDKDREKAGQVLDAAGFEHSRRLLSQIAQAIADEREKALAPLLALADELTQKALKDWDNNLIGTARVAADAADAIRRAVGQQP